MKLYTKEEADELLPFLAPALTELRDKSRRAEVSRSKVEKALAGNGAGAERQKLTRLTARIEELLERLASWEVIVRDIEQGLIDFPGSVDGEPAFLCWKLGEEKVSFWHRPDEGFAGRRPL